MIKALSNIKSFKVLVLFLLFSGISFAQVSQNSELEKINHKIESLRKKKKHVKADTEEHKKAVESGWYQDIDASLKKLFDKKRVLIKEQTGKTFVSKEEFLDLPEEKRLKMQKDDNYIIEK